MTTVYLICYDITCDRRRLKISKLLEAYGIRVQKSVFETVLTPTQYQTLETKINNLLNPKEDQLRFYPLTQPCRAKVKILGLTPDYKIDDEVLIV